MSKLKIMPHIPEGKKFSIAIGDDRRYVDQFTEAVEFDLPQGEYTVQITQLYQSTYNKIGWWLFYVLTLPIRAVLNVIFLNTDDEVPDLFLLTATAIVSLTRDMTTLELLLVEKEGRQQGLRFTLSESQDSRSVYRFSRARLMDHYADYVKRLMSVGLLCEALFAFLLYQGILHGNVWMIGVCAVVLVGLAGSCGVLLRKKWVRVKKLQEDHEGEPGKGSTW